MAFITDSGGPYGFSLFASFANASYSSSEACRGAACPAGIAPRVWASRSAAPTFNAPIAAATLPTKLRRDTACFTFIRSLRSVHILRANRRMRRGGLVGWPSGGPTHRSAPHGRLLTGRTPRGWCLGHFDRLRDRQRDVVFRQ